MMHASDNGHVHKRGRNRYGIPARSLTLLAGILLLLVWPTHSNGQDNQQVVRVASYNVENYLLMDRRVDGRWRRDYPKPESEKEALRQILCEVAADVLALQEMGSASDLEELRRDLHAMGLDYPHAYLMHGPDEIRRTAILAKFPFTEVIGHSELDFAYRGGREVVKRGLLEAVFETQGIHWTLFVVHLKSRWTEHADDPRAQQRRTREAQACRDLIREKYPPETHPHYLVVGDFNDTRASAPLQRFLTVGDTVLTKMIPCADSRGERWTFHWERQDIYDRIDYLLASPAMFPQVIGGQGSIYDRQPLTERASDHRLIFVDLVFPAGGD